MIKRLITTTIIALLGVMVAACNKTTDIETVVTLPAIIQAYDRSPFGREHFHVFKRSVEPAWELAKKNYTGIELLEYGISSNITKDEIHLHIQKTLGENWTADPSLSQQSDWGWSIGFRNRKKLLMFVTIDRQRVNISEDFPVIPAGLITNIQVKPQNIISISSPINK